MGKLKKYSGKFLFAPKLFLSPSPTAMYLIHIDTMAKLLTSVPETDIFITLLDLWKVIKILLSTVLRRLLIFIFGHSDFQCFKLFSICNRYTFEHDLLYGAKHFTRFW